VLKVMNNQCGWVHLQELFSYDHKLHGIPVTSQYAVPVSNQYSVLTNHHELHEPSGMILSSNSEQSARFVPVSNHKYIKGLQRKETLIVNQMYLQRNKPNLQEPMNNEDGAWPIPTLVNPYPANVENMVSS